MGYFLGRLFCFRVFMFSCRDCNWFLEELLASKRRDLQVCFVFMFWLEGLGIKRGEKFG